MQPGTQEHTSSTTVAETPHLKNDRYRRARGGNATFMTLYCSKCSSWLLLYQKDGEGTLFRCYLNRIFAPAEIERLQRDSSIEEPGDLKPLSCQTCNAVIGIPMRYHDGRLAFRLIHGSFFKKRGVRRP